MNVACPYGNFINAGALATGTAQVAAAVIASNGTLTFNFNGAAGGWTSSGLKGLNGPIVLHWLLS
jgi:hypothetical protein